MRKVLVVGSGGAGKSTFAKRLGAALDIAVIHLDQHYWRPGWTKMPDEEWTAVVRSLLARDSWVMDGNFGGTRAMRLEACDTVIFLDMPRRVCLYRVLKRAIIYRNRTRPDMADGCRERFDWDFIMWVWNYPRGARTRLKAEIERNTHKNFIVLRSRGAVETFLNGL